MNTLLEILSIAGFIQGILIGALVIFHKKFKKVEFTYLGILMVVMGIDCLNQSVMIITEYPVVYWINNGNLLLFGPLFYFFIKSVSSGSLPNRREVLLHLIPFILIKCGTLILGPTNLGEELLPTSFFTVLNQLISLHGIGYAILALILVLKSRSQGESSMKNFPFWLAMFYALGWTSSFLGRQLELYDEEIANMLWSSSYLVLLIIIYIITIQLMVYNGKDVKSALQIQNEGYGSKDKYARSSLSKMDLQKLEKELTHKLHEKKIFLDPELNRSKLAGQLNVSPHTLSQLLNNHLKKNFFDYINEFRVEEAKKKLADPKYRGYTILAVAFESGFKSKSSFQRIFKKHTGQTPSIYFQSLQDTKESKVI